ncbi:Aste57867_1438 [Aphanomyces stellatus]|uniref:Aste57867_1438 protein n=1 Tax=Aphanomyces stellatus TaxID=120398 RepID=A0A485K5A5_9STRA|nr:hypothetical protein As57867_001437 [Aphanomyces stellatus]VFT78655.1 Aste57867_1438 [Aphanomyces stellatus]
MSVVACRQQVDHEHEYLRTQVDPLLMPLIESLLLYQPSSIYDFILKFIDGVNLGHMKHMGDATRSAKARRHRMVDFMSSSVLPVMDDLTQRIMAEKPSNVHDFLREIVQTRLHHDAPLPDHDSLVLPSFRVGDRVECRFKGRPKYVPGVVDAVDGGTYTIRYENGKVEEHIHPILLRRPEDDNQTTAAACSQPEGEPGCREIHPVLLLLGLDGAGKSTLLATLQGDLDKSIPPTAGFSPATFQLPNGVATFYDLGGGPTIRAAWKEYYADAHGVIYVVDAADGERIAEAAARLDDAMSHPLLRGKPLLIYANKVDQPHALSELDFAAAMHVERYAVTKTLRSITKAKANGHRVDDRLETGLMWMLHAIEADYDALSTRVAENRAEKKKHDAAAWQAQKERVWAYKEEKERALMLAEDNESTQAMFKKPDTARKQPKGDGPVCSTCQTEPAVTKCAASKWMPVCAGCAETLKKKA